MTSILWWVVGIYLTIATALLIANARPHAQEAAVLRFQTSVGVPLPQWLGEQLRQRLLVTRRSQLIGGMVGIVLSASSVRTEPDTLQSAIVVTGVFAGGALGVAIATLLSTQRVTGGEVRYARSQAVGLSDYVPGLELWLARTPAALAVVYFSAWGVGSWAGLIPPADVRVLLGGAVLTLLAVASLIIFEVAGRRIVATGNRVSSPEELVWEDAIRSRTVRDIVSAPVLVGLYAILYSLPALFNDGVQSWFITWTGSVIAGGIVLAALITLVLRPERHFLRRLWPELAATTGKPDGADAASSPDRTQP